MQGKSLHLLDHVELVAGIGLASILPKDGLGMTQLHFPKSLSHNGQGPGGLWSPPTTLPVTLVLSWELCLGLVLLHIAPNFAHHRVQNRELAAKQTKKGRLMKRGRHGLLAAWKGSCRSYLEAWTVSGKRQNARPAYHPAVMMERLGCLVSPH
eukprot:3373022-Amphidinium_carterae.1